MVRIVRGEGAVNVTELYSSKLTRPGEMVVVVMTLMVVVLVTLMVMIVFVMVMVLMALLVMIVMVVVLMALMVMIVFVMVVLMGKLLALYQTRGRLPYLVDGKSEKKVIDEWFNFDKPFKHISVGM